MPNASSASDMLVGRAVEGGGALDLSVGECLMRESVYS